MHAWGDSLEEAFEQCAVAMFGYMTDLDYVEPKSAYSLAVEGHDMESLLYNFLNELLFVFSTEPFLVPKVRRTTRPGARRGGTAELRAASNAALSSVFHPQLIISGSDYIRKS